MKLQYKVTFVVIFFILFFLSSLSVVYSRFSYEEVVAKELEILLDSAVDTASHIEGDLIDKMYIAKTLASAPIVIDTLLKSNGKYQELSQDEQKKKITALNEKWKSSKGTDNLFIREYLNNALSKYLTNQQDVLPEVYGEIFITNRYGVMIATTGELSTLAHAHKYWWKESYNNDMGKVFFDDRGFDESVQGYVIGVVIPIKKDGEIIGILKSNVNIIGTLNNVINNYNSKKHGTLSIVRTKGLTVLEEGAIPLSTNVNPKLLENLKALESSSRTISNKVKESFIAYTPVELALKGQEISFGGEKGSGEHFKGNQQEVWHTVVEYDLDEALLSSRNANKKIIIITLAFILLSIIPAIFIGRWISRDELKEEVKRRKEAEDELIEKDKLMIVQSRHAAMGEMISMLAHQWRQPINAIAMGANNIVADIELNTIDDKTLKRDAKSIVAKTKELSETIEGFRNFFKPEEVPEEIFIDDLINNTIDIIGNSLNDNGIEVLKDFRSSMKINIYPEKFSQVLLNLLQNANEILVKNALLDKKILISTEDEEDDIVIKVCDNGGGVKLEIIDEIFNPYFSEKSKNVGTGLGLYIANTIVEKHLDGVLNVYNLEDGACFEIKLPSTIK